MSTTSAAPRRVLPLGLDKLSGLYLWLAFIVVFGIARPSTFLSMTTVHQIAAQQSLVGLIALAALVPLVAGAYDLSIGANVNLCTIVVVVLQTKHGMGMWPAIVLALLVGLAVGLLNGIVVVGLKVNSFIATLGSATVLSAVQTIVAGGVAPLPPISTAWNNLTQTTVLGFQVVFAYLIVVALLMWWFLALIPAGRYLHAVGSNREAAQLTGISVGRWTLVAMTLSGAICGLTGVLYASYIGPSLSFGPSLLLPAFAAAFLGATQFRPGRFNVWGTLLAIFALATGVFGLQLLTSAQWLNDMFNGVALIGAVSFAVWRQRAAQTRRDVARGQS
jgi:ribose transport system permease protein